MNLRIIGSRIEKPMYSSFLFYRKILFGIMLMSCSSGPCHREISNEQSSAGPINKKILQVRESAGEPMDQKVTHEIYRVYVYKSDGTIQCEPSIKAIPLVTIKKELEDAKIQVFEATHMDSGMMMITLCGAPTTKIYRFQIPKSDLEKAIKLGFKEWIPQ
ncbi:MAG: hypothetical protein NZ480_06920 [Bdellovibrionaceae bacterium]|nr:hypothetical protein [Pseudobdellovibrionaceae bacterium]MDW8191141.1 hypothetical protein [Pseudobdellovibrionaceae bacterium]